MGMKVIKAEVEFVTDMPEGIDGDKRADDLSDEIASAVQRIDGVAEGSVRVTDWDES